MYALIYYITYVPLFIVTIFVLAPCLLECAVGQNEQSETSHDVESDAIILNLELRTTKESCVLGKINFQVQVQPRNKRNYVMEFDLDAKKYSVKQFQVGKKVRIRFDPLSPGNVLLIRAL